jgi:hypothetical protein
MSDTNSPNNPYRSALRGEIIKSVIMIIVAGMAASFSKRTKYYLVDAVGMPYIIGWALVAVTMLTMMYGCYYFLSRVVSVMERRDPRSVLFWSPKTWLSSLQ